MYSFSCLIFEDDNTCVDEIMYLIKKYLKGVSVIGVGNTESECRKLMTTTDVDVIFTDIHFKNRTVFEMLPELKDFPGDIVFISGDNNYASEAFQLSASYYFLKPVKEQAFESFFEDFVPGKNRPDNITARSILHGHLNSKLYPPQRIAFNTNEGYLVHEVDNVIYAKAFSNYTEFYLSDGSKVLTSKTLLSYEKALSNYGFFRIHQSYLINLKYVVMFHSEDMQVKLKNNALIPVSSRKKSAFLDILKSLF